jgi:uncharacterized repeat protein (TIGR01451 family)
MVFMAIPSWAWADQPPPHPAPRVATPVWAQLAKLGGVLDPQGDLSDGFGSAVAMEGDTAVVGVPGKDGEGSEDYDTGTVFVFVRVGSTWTRQATLLPPTPVAQLHFGSSVAISGDTVVVGAPGSNSSPTGRAYVYVRSGQSWTVQATLVGLDTAWTDAFAANVAVSGDTAVVTAPEADTPFGYDSGAVYVFARSGSTWSQQQKLLSTDLAAQDYFGTSVAIEGDTTLVGAPGDDTGVAGSGSAYVFTRTGVVWTQQQKLLPSNAASGDWFASAIGLSGTVAVVSAPAADSPNASDSGKVVVFEAVGGVWTQTATLVSPTPQTYARFGNTIAVSGGVVVVGSVGSASPPPAVQVFRRGGGTWTFEASFPPSGSVPIYYGAPVAASGGSILVGEPYLDATGAAFVFTFAAGAWAEQARLDNTGSNQRDAFGSVVVVDGDTMAVGSPADDTLSARGSGSVTLFTRASGVWSVRQKLLPEAAGTTRNFGRALALEGDVLVVGAGTVDYFDDGCAYVFRNTGIWTLEQKLAPEPGGAGHFGASVALRGATILVGEPNATVDRGSFSGAVSVLTRPSTTWVEQQRLLPANPGSRYAQFGAGLALGDAVAVIGAPGLYDTGPQAHVFRRTAATWSLSQEIPPPASGEAFGASIAMDGLDLAIGAPGANYSGGGSAYVLRDAGGSYSLTHPVACPAAAARSVRCGASVDLSPNTLLVGGPWDGLGGGSVSVFARTAGQVTLQQGLFPSDTPPAGFGVSAVLAGSQILVGASNVQSNAAGAVYVFGSATSDLTMTMTANPLVVSQGDFVTVTLALTNRGAAPVSGTAVVLNLKPGLVFVAATQGSCSTSPGDGTCVFGTVGVGSTGVVAFKAVAATIGSFPLSATVPGGAFAQANTTILGASADVVATVATPSNVGRGETVTYGIYVRNDGPAAAAAVLVNHPTPPGLVPRSVGYACVALPCTLPRIAPGPGYEVEVTYYVPLDYNGPSPIVNIVTATGANADPLPGNNRATGSTPFRANATRLRFHTVSPCRLVDTRDATLGGPSPLPPGPARYSAAAGPCGIPGSARAIAVNVTATEPSHSGFLKVYPANSGIPDASSMNYAPGSTRANNGVVGLDASSGFVVEVGQAAGTVHVIVDVVGYFQ